MSKIARHAAFVVLSLLTMYFFVSNWLWVKTKDDLSELTDNHQYLSGQYHTLLHTQQKNEKELGQLRDVFGKVVQQRDKLALENIRIDILNATLAAMRQETDSLKKEVIDLPILQSNLSQVLKENDRLLIEKAKVEQINISLDSNVSSLDKSLDELEKMLNLRSADDVSEDRFERLSILTKQRLFFLNSIPNGLPIKAIRVSDKFGMRYHPIKKVRILHKGIDYKATTGTSVYAPADGVVSMVERRGGNGKYVKIIHNFGFETSYSHLSKYAVKVGEYVQKGQKIAESGNTGLSTGPHLHYELSYLSKAINPASFVSWNIANFDEIFTKVESVKWASLKNLYPLTKSVQH